MGIVLCVPFAFLLSEVGSYQAAMAITGVWWLAFIYKPWKYLHTRPGEPLPPGRTYITQSFWSVVDTAKELWALKRSLYFVLLWMVYSDASFLIGSIGGLYANSEVEWGCFPKSLGILLMFFLVPIFAAVGNMGMLKCGQRCGLRSKTMLIIALTICSLIPLYAMIGFFSKKIGVRQGWEMILVACAYGFTIGPIQSYARSLFSTLTPKGRETAFFSLYELTNRGSSALGPLVLTAIQQGSGDLRYGFIFVFTNIAIPAILLAFLNEKQGAQDAQEAGRRAAAAKHAQQAAGSGSVVDDRKLVATGTGTGTPVQSVPVDVGPAGEGGSGSSRHVGSGSQALSIRAGAGVAALTASPTPVAAETPAAPTPVVQAMPLLPHESQAV